MLIVDIEAFLLVFACGANEVCLRHAHRFRQHAHVREGAFLAEEPPEAQHMFRASTVHVRSRVEELRAIRPRLRREATGGQDRRQCRQTLLSAARAFLQNSLQTISADIDISGAENSADNFADKFTDKLCKHIIVQTSCFFVRDGHEIIDCKKFSALPRGVARGLARGLAQGGRARPRARPRPAARSSPARRSLGRSGSGCRSSASSARLVVARARIV